MATEEATQRVRSIAQPILDSLGYELYDLQVIHQGRRGLVRITIDRSEGIGLEDCERASQSISHALDLEDPVPFSYTLEVSSPGLDRRLRNREDYVRYAGRLVKIKFAEPWQGHWAVLGRLVGLETSPEGEEVTVEREGGERLRIPLSKIAKSRLEPEW